MIPDWLATDALLAHFAKQRAAARRRYRQFVMDGLACGSIWSGLRQQIYLGEDEFVRRTQATLRVQGDKLTVPRTQRRGPVPSIKAIARKFPERNVAICEAYATGAYSYREIAEFFGIHLATVGRAVRE